MDILFCDLCNESVPQADLDLGWAFRRNGRLVCARCDAAMTASEGAARSGAAGVEGTGTAGAATLAVPAAAAGRAVHGAERPASTEGEEARPHARAGAGTGGVLVGLSALVFAAGGSTLLLDRIEEDGQRQSEQREQLGDSLAQLTRDQARLAQALDARLAESEQRAFERGEAERVLLRQEFAALDERLIGVRELAGGVGQSLDLLRTELAAEGVRTRQDVERMQSLTERMDEDLRFHRDRLIELEENLRGMVRGAPSAAYGAASGGASGADAGEPGAPAWAPLLADLEHASAAIRLEAIYGLAETRDAEVVAHLVPMLGDGDLFVRMATARTLQNLSAKSAVPALIDALEDPESAVKEAAMIALRDITQRNFRFDPLASEAERGKRVKAWRDWWRKEGEGFMQGS